MDAGRGGGADSQMDGGVGKARSEKDTTIFDFYFKELTLIIPRHVNRI